MPGAGAGAAAGLGAAAGPRAMAGLGAAAGLATPRRAAAGPRAAAGLSGGGERRVNGPRGKKAMWAENEEGEEIIIFTFYFPNKFSQKHFQIIFDFI